MKISFILSAVIVLAVRCTSGYKMVFMIHGVMSDKGSLDFLSEYIKQAHPGTEIHNMNLFAHYYSLEPIWKQVKGFKAEMEKLLNNQTEEVHLIAHSQGGLIARGIIESWDNHNISSFISLSSPQAGQFGDGFLHLVFPGVVRDEAYRLFYNRIGQYTSVGNYWNDPHEQEEYRQYSKFLAPVNNEAFTDDSKRFRRNLCRLKRLVLIGGPDDGVITPWQSSQFGFYTANMTVLNVRQREGYRKDRNGLRTLDKRDALILHTFDGVQHLTWHHNITVIRQAVLPYLD
ncbi:lysosomal thioesterase PPT2 homolog [Pollicipes pollicipes]|uniref:lysosomal thioesterase PPT2 homolog n=1 Tax=Pollicipes pollicipes TaxID=41117 RepID=UPI0018850E38|nr:lysosomal thioesterase PPT2 homolog [Pollicipes pollicipes]